MGTIFVVVNRIELFVNRGVVLVNNLFFQAMRLVTAKFVDAILCLKLKFQSVES